MMSIPVPGYLKKAAVFTFIIALFVLPLVSFAQGAKKPGGTEPPGGGQPTLCDPLNCDGPGSSLDIRSLPKKIVDALMQIGVVVIVLAFLYAGFKYVTALGDQKAIDSAHQIFKYTVIGAAVLLGSGVLAEVIQGTINAITKPS
mgnify:CR=1 FL=1